MKLIDPYPTSITYKKKVYQLDLSLKTVLLACEVLDDEVMDDEYKVKLTLDLLIPGKHPADCLLLGAIFKLLFPKKSKEKPVIDFDMDSALIVSAFRQAYGIDLKKELTSMHFMEFSDLLQGIPKNTRLSERIELRTMDIPEPTKYNAKQRAKIIEAKSKVQIHRKSDKAEGLYALYSGMMSAVKAGG